VRGLELGAWGSRFRILGSGFVALGFKLKVC
jgi:hypothetical protein